jgi:hypothetical protein
MGDSKAVQVRRRAPLQPVPVPGAGMTAQAVAGLVLAVDGITAKIAGARFTWSFQCSACRQVTRTESTGNIRVGLSGSAQSAAWYHREQPGPKPVPARCAHCDDERPFLGRGEREARAVLFYQDVVELLDEAWTAVRAAARPADRAVADRKWGIRPQ